LNCKDTNYELIEKFGSLEKICNQIYGEKHGVTAYIDDMAKNNDFGEVYVCGWSDFLQGLKDVRHKRNQLSHGDVPFASDYAQEDDLKFIDNFHELILTQNDPLTILRKEHERHLKEAEKKIKEQKANKEKQKATERQHSKKANQTKEKPIMSKKISAAIWIVIAAAFIALICFLGFR